MKRTILLICSVTMAVILSVGATLAQGDMPGMKPMPKDGMDMAKMHADGHHALMMAYQHNALAFTRALWEMTANGKIDDVDMARAAFGEIKRSMDKMGEIEKMHMSTMGKMDPAMTEKMKPMMEKMQAEKAGLMMHVMALGTALQQTSPNASEVEMHAASILLRLEKMSVPEPKMAM
jgi:hypothetical protein